MVTLNAAFGKLEAPHEYVGITDAMLPRVLAQADPPPGSSAASGGQMHEGAALGMSVLFHFDALGHSLLISTE